MATETFSVEHARAWMTAFGKAVSENQEYLTELDSAIGDADHGTNMDRGMRAVEEKLGATDPTTLGSVFKTVGMALVSTVGGASGPLYGTFFLRMGAALGDKSECDKADLSSALRAGIKGVIDRGKAQLGDKTMFDALSPALDSFDETGGLSIAAAAAGAAEAAAAGRDATAPLKALKGRASYLGDRSIGHIDPGSASAALLMGALAKACA